MGNASTAFTNTLEFRAQCLDAAGKDNCG